MHPNEAALAGFLDASIQETERSRVEAHLSSCDECLTAAVAADEAVEKFHKDRRSKNMRAFFKIINIYLVISVVSFAISFAIPRFFIQSLVATLLFGMKWIADSRTTKTLVMIHDAWKRGEDKEVSRILSGLKKEDRKARF